jgi:hypothetical protein
LLHHEWKRREIRRLAAAYEKADGADPQGLVWTVRRFKKALKEQF